ncbi:MAG: ATP synthase F1 subunit epsilon [Gemmatimonadota bacterium]|nr:MAG: ATP synthase F1 subunit epsilon [Gemmatimonadota bacterium]
MRVTIISPERSVFDGEATSVVAPAYDGMVGILPRHAPFMTLLGDGTLTVRQDDSTREFHVRGGFLQILDDTVNVVAEHAGGEGNE